MPTPLCPITALSPWSRRYAIAPDARLMTAPNTSRPREGATPQPVPATGSGPQPAASPSPPSG